MLSLLCRYNHPQSTLSLSLPLYLWQPNKDQQLNAEAQQRHKTRAGVPDEERDKSRMDGENGAEKSRRMSEDIWLEDQVNKSTADHRRARSYSETKLQLTFSLVAAILQLFTVHVLFQSFFLVHYRHNALTFSIRDSYITTEYMFYLSLLDYCIASN